MRMKNNNFSISKRLSLPVLVLSILLLTATSVTLAALLKTNTSREYRTYYKKIKAGEIADKSLFARVSVDAVDYEATLEARENAAASVLPVFTYSAEKTNSLIKKYDRIRSVFLSGENLNTLNLTGRQVVERLTELSDPALVSLIYNFISDLAKKGFYDSFEIMDLQKDGYDSFVLTNRYSDKNMEDMVVKLDSELITSDNLETYIAKYFDEYSENVSLQDLIIIKDIINLVVEPNVYFDSVLFDERRDFAYQSIQPVVLNFNKGDLLLERNHVVTQEQLNHLYLLSIQSVVSFSEILTNAVFLLLIFSVLMTVFVRFVNGNKKRMATYVVLLSLLDILSAVFSYFSISISVNLYDLRFSEVFFPSIFLPVLITMITSQKSAGYIASLINATGFILIPDATIMTFFYVLFCGVVCVLMVRFLNKRFDVVLLWFTSLILISLINIFFIYFDYSFSEMKIDLLVSLINITLALFLVSIILPFVEYIFNLPTRFRLNELAFTESALLTRLNQVAPGTYNHSQNVAELARSAAKAVGADYMLAYVGGLYHDVGKIEHPEFFVENQSGDNKHEGLNPGLSASIIKNHVKAGAQKGREFRLPAEIIDIIANHHGNDVIRYFYQEAKETDADARSEDFRYQADIPSTKECAIVMIADCVEAAARAVSAPSSAKFSKLLVQLINNRIESGQLNNSHLTMNNLQSISNTMLKTLLAQYHSRIEYPDEEKN